MLQAAADSCQLLQATANGKLKINREGVQHQQLLQLYLYLYLCLYLCLYFCLYFCFYL